MGDETRVQVSEVKKGVGAAGSIVERYMIRLLGPVGRKIASATRAGRIMALIGVVGVAVSVVLVATDAISVRTEIVKGVLVVAKPKANLRDKASTKGKVVAKVEKGETLSYISHAEGWYKVRALEGTGWIAQEMTERKGNRTAIIEYEMKGYGIVFLAGLALLIVGIMQKQKSS